jgi:methylaspartate mutase sigma subunit
VHGGAAELSEPPVVLFGVIGNDIHVVANRVLHLCLEAHGFRAVNLGTNNMPEDFADAALEVDAAAVLISSLNGEAAHWCRDLRSLFTERGLAGVKIYLGGNVVTGDRPKAEVEALFRGYGVDRVYYGYADFDEVLDTLAEDLDGRA